MAADAGHNIDVAMHASGHNAISQYGFNFQLAHSSQSPVTELRPSQKGGTRILTRVVEKGQSKSLEM
jgi:hypothetical protein